MYFPIFKNRMYENKLLKEQSNVFFDKKIMPIIEVINLKENEEVKDLINYYDKALNSMYFLDFFAFRNEDYNSYTRRRVRFSLSIKDNNKYNYLEDLLLSTRLSYKAIPVLSIKRARNFILEEEVIEKYIMELQKHKPSIAIRLEAELFDSFFDVINNILRKNDYFMFDIGKNKVDSLILQQHDFENRNNKSYTSIILNSPRNPNIYNSSYEEETYTDLIDNHIASDYKSLGFDGFGDYLGLNDELPKDGGSGKSAAHVLFYNYKNNKFFSLLNKDTTLGIKGFENVINKIVRNESELNSNYDCLAYEYIITQLINRNTNGNWAVWKYILMLRTLSEMKRVYR